MNKKNYKNYLENLIKRLSELSNNSTQAAHNEFPALVHLDSILISILILFFQFRLRKKAKPQRTGIVDENSIRSHIMYIQEPFFILLSLQLLNTYNVDLYQEDEEVQKEMFRDIIELFLRQDDNYKEFIMGWLKEFQ